MRDSKNSGSGLASQDHITLGLLDAVQENSAVTQRSMARELGIALGLANAYLKRCVKKGYIKVSQAPANRYAYYLTPHGFAEKSRLTTEYLTSSFTFFRTARNQCGEAFARCDANGWQRVALYGVSELAEIAAYCSAEHQVVPVAIVDGENGSGQLAGIPIVAGLDAIEDGVDAVLLTALTAPQASFEALVESYPSDRVLTPKLLRVARQPAPAGED